MLIIWKQYVDKKSNENKIRNYNIKIIDNNNIKNQRKANYNDINDFTRINNKHKGSHI